MQSSVLAVKMIYIVLTFVLAVRCSAYHNQDRSSSNREHYNHHYANSRQDSPTLELSDYFIPVVAISFFTSLFSSIGKLILKANTSLVCSNNLISHSS